MSSRNTPPLIEWIKKTGLKFSSIDPTKARPIKIEGTDAPISVASFLKKAAARGNHLFSEERYAAIGSLVYIPEKAQEILFQHAYDTGLVPASSRSDSEVIDLDKLPEQMRGLTLYLDPTIPGGNRKSNCWYLVNKENRVVNYSADHYIAAAGIRNPIALEGLVIAAKKYVPFQKPGILKNTFDEMGSNLFNIYQPPSWKDVPNNGEPTKLPLLFRKLMTAMFPIKKELEFVLAWMAKSISGRAQTHLVLFGNPGVGKNRLKLVMRALHGFSNTVDGKQSSLRKFNSQLKDCTLLWYDELKYGPEEIPTLKEIPNESMSIEQKGEDATKASEIFASVVISNNKLRDNHLEFNDRKFSPVVLRKSRLEKAMHPDEIAELTEKANVLGKNYDNEFIAQIARYLRRKYKNAEEIFPNMEYRGKMFWKIAHTSMTKAQKRAVDIVLGAGLFPETSPLTPSKNGFIWSQVEAQLDKKLKDLKLADNTTFQSFFDNFRGPNGERIFKTKNMKKNNNYTNDFYITFVDEVKDSLAEIFAVEDMDGEETEIGFEIEDLIGGEKEELGKEGRKTKQRRIEAANRPRQASAEDSDRPGSKTKKQRDVEEDSDRSGRSGKATLRRSKNRRKVSRAE